MEDIRSSRARLVFRSDGEMARLCRRMDWSRTPLGPIEAWPQSLRTVAGLTISCALPSVLLWGDDLIQIYNDGCVPFYGSRHPRALGRPRAEVWPEYAEANRALFDRVWAGESVAIQETGYSVRRDPAGPEEEVFVDLTLTPVSIEDGSVGGIIVTLLDATARVHERLAQDQVQRMSRELERERSRIAETFAQTPAFMATTRGPDHVFEMVNPAFQAMLPGRRLINRPARQALAEIDGQELFEKLDEVYETGEPVAAAAQSVRLRKQTGGSLREGRFNFVYQPIRDSTGAVTGILMHGIDVTELMESKERLQVAEAAIRAEERRLRKALDELRRSEEKYRVLMEQASEGIFVQSGIDAGFIDLNSTACEMLGYPRDELLGMKPSDVLHEEDPVRRQERHEQLRTGKTLLTQRVARRKDGTTFPVELHTKVLPDGRVQTFAKDISERIDREVRLRRAERLASLGTLISGVAHELNNPLNAIQNFSQLLIEDEPPPNLREDLETIQREAVRMARIVSELRLVVGAEADAEPMKGPVDLGDIVRHVVRTRERELRAANVSLELDLRADGAVVTGDRSQLEQVVVNLLVNAEQALRSVSGERGIEVRTRCARGRLHLEVADNGPGISEEDVERIFDPFWTTKNPGEGTGLGLSLVQRIVMEHHGEVRVRSRAGDGAAFQVLLPLRRLDSGSESARPEREEKTANAPLRPLRVLVVDDESANRRVLARALATRGHRTEEGVNGSEALDLLLKNDYDVIVSDLRMPGMTGEELLQQIRSKRPGLAERFVLLTGDPAGAADLIRDTATPVLLKPVRLAEAIEVIERQASGADTLNTRE